MSRLSRVLIALTAIVSVVILFAVPRWAQDPSYHQFADVESRFGIPHFFDVTSNVGFFICGSVGLLRTSRKRADVRGLWRIFSWSILLTSLGSAWYHLAPDHDSLLWDRLPMSVGFVAFLLLVAEDYLRESWIRLIRVYALALAPLTVLWWWVSEKLGRGDLRPYALIQALPLFLTLVIVANRNARSPTSKLIFQAVVAYIVAKIFEYNDYGFHQSTGMISGHTMKHLIAAYACLLLLVSGLGEGSPDVPDLDNRL